MCPFGYTAFVVSWKLWTSVGWLSLLQLTEVYGGIFVLSGCFWGFSVGVGDFVIGLSQISSFSSLSKAI